MSTTKAEVLANPEAHGFTFALGEVQQDKIPLGDVPLIQVINLTLFDASFPGVAINAINGGQSIRVACQGIGRTARWEDRKVSVDALKEKCVDWLMGIKRSARTVTVVKQVKVYVADDGTEFTDKTEYMEYNAALRA